MQVKKVLIIGKQKKNESLSIITQRQADSIKKYAKNISVNTYKIELGGFIGYFKSYIHLKKYLKNNDFNIIHAHYSFSGVLTLLSSKKKNVVISFMGTDAFSNTLLARLSRWFVLNSASHIIVKSSKVLQKLNTTKKNISIIPNGVNLETFSPTNKINSKKALGWHIDKIHILFPSEKNRSEKNYQLAKASINEMSKKLQIEMHFLEDIAPNEVSIHLNAADIVLLTSEWEGSSNVTKEAMACNTIVVSTDVGDAKELFDQTPGYFITNHIVSDVIEKLERAIQFLREKKLANGRRRIIELGLDESSISNKILTLYKNVDDYHQLQFGDKSKKKKSSSLVKLLSYKTFVFCGFYLVILLFFYLFPLSQKFSLNRYHYLSFRGDHIIHLLVFTPLPFLFLPLFLKQSKWRILKASFSALIIAICFELSHLFVPYRAFTFEDLTANIFGVILGLIFVMIKCSWSSKN